ncbi:MAG: hypothetical protein AAF322_12500 [Pseudomonadota bacterium]
MAVRDTLRRSTAEIHAEAEALFWSGDRFASADAYRRFLWAMREAHVRFGLPAATLLDGDRGAAREARLIALLDDDLDRAGSPPAATPAMEEARAWGAAYALSGSALGAATILKTGGAPEGCAAAYLRAQAAAARGGETRRFFDALDARGPTTEAARRAAVEAASAVFAAIIDAFGDADAAAAL